MPLAVESLDLPHDAAWTDRVAVDRWTPELEKNRLLLESLLGEPVPDLAARIEVNRAALEDVRRDLAIMFAAPGPWWVFHPGVGRPVDRRYPHGRWAEVLGALRADGIEFLLAGGPADGDVIETLVATMPSHTFRAVHVFAANELARLAAVLSCAHGYLGCDSGPGHLAAVLGCPSVLVYGGGTWGRFVPAGDRAWVVHRPLPCFQCDWRCPFDAFPCIGTIPPQVVVHTAREALRAGRAAPSGNRLVACEPPAEEAQRFIRSASETLRASATDRTDLRRQVEELARAAHHQESDRAALRRQVVDLTASVRSGEADRQDLRRQVRELTRTLQAVWEHSADRLRQVEELTDTLHEVREDSDDRLRQIRELTAELGFVRKHSDDRLRQIRDLTDALRVVQKDSDDRLRQIRDLTDALRVLRKDSDDRLRQIRELTDSLRAVRTDSDERLRQVRELTRSLHAVRQESDDRLRRIQELAAALGSAERPAGGR
jgi:hypothetical protein